MSPSTPDQALRKFSCSLIFLPSFKSGVIKPQPMAEASYWFYCRKPWDILMMYCSINGNWWDRYWWRMVHFAAIHWVPVTLPVPHHLWKCCALACKLSSACCCYLSQASRAKELLLCARPWVRVFKKTLCHLVLTADLGGSYCDHSHFTDKEVKMQIWPANTPWNWDSNLPSS